MEVGAVKAPEFNQGIPGQRAGTPVESKLSEVEAAAQVRIEEEKASAVQDGQDVKKADVPQSIEAVNQFLDLMNADLRFSLHQKTNRLMVQLVSEKDHKVLREYPPKEFLDMIARMRDVVGNFMDKKA